MADRVPNPTGIDVIDQHTTALIDLAAASDAAAPVATCGDWTMADLVWHLSEVQAFWAWTIANRPAGPDQYVEPIRPPDAELPDALRARCRQLLDALADADADEPAWSWSDDHTVGFTLRRQSHEALVHRIDGELAAGRTVPTVPADLAADGVDEMITVMLTGVPEWGHFRPTRGTIRVLASDTADAWTLGFGRMTGTSPTTGTAYDLDALELLDPASIASPTAIVSGDALDLDLWLWGRVGDAAVTIEGSPDVVGLLRSIIDEVSG